MFGIRFSSPVARCPQSEAGVLLGNEVLAGPPGRWGWPLSLATKPPGKEGPSGRGQVMEPGRHAPEQSIVLKPVRRSRGASSPACESAVPPLPVFPKFGLLISSWHISQGTPPTWDQSLSTWETGCWGQGLAWGLRRSCVLPPGAVALTPPSGMTREGTPSHTQPQPQTLAPRSQPHRDGRMGHFPSDWRKSLPQPSLCGSGP